MVEQYAVSISDAMNTYGVAVNQSNFYIEIVTATINAEIDKGARFVRGLYVDGKPCILVFERDVRCRG